MGTSTPCHVEDCLSINTQEITFPLRKAPESAD